MSIAIFTVIVLTLLAISAAILLYIVAQKFKVFEDPRIDEVEALLPAANCGACGYPGCRAFAEAFVRAEDISSFSCPVGGASVNVKIALAVGLYNTASDPLIAVLKCNGTCAARPQINNYDGAKSCAISASLYSGATACLYGCLGFGDCVNVCQFGAMYLDSESGLPVIIEDKCVACEKCVKSCPKAIIEMRKRGPQSHRIFVACANIDKGGVAQKACKSACIGCMKCQKVCSFDAITIEKNLAYISDSKCELCRKCIDVCPTKAIIEVINKEAIVN